MVADSQVVLETEGLQHHAIPHREREPQLIVVGGWKGKESVSHMPLATTGTQTLGLWDHEWGSLSHTTPILGCPLRGTHRCGSKKGHRSWVVCPSAHQGAHHFF